MTTYTATLRLPDGEEFRLAVLPAESILDAAARGGLELPHRCLQGWCLSCAGRLVAGYVDQRAARRYYPEDAQEGFVLLCTARPTSDVVVETHARDAMRAARIARGLPCPRGDWGDGRSGAPLSPSPRRTDTGAGSE